MTEDTKAAETTAQEKFVPPVKFSDDGKEAEWKISDTETAKVPVGDLPDIYHKAKGYDKQGQELGTLRPLRDRYSDIDKMIAESEDPEAVLTRIRETLKTGPKPKGTTTTEDEDPWGSLFGEQKPASQEPPKDYLTKEEFEKEYTSRRTQERASERADAEVQQAMNDLKIPDGLRPLIEQATYIKALDSDGSVKLRDLVKSEFSRVVDAVKARDAEEAAALEKQKIEAGASISGRGQPAAATDDPRRKMDTDSPEYRAYLAERAKAILERPRR